MTVDIRLNQMIDALDGRLKSIRLEDVELSIRTFKALKDCGADTLHDAQMALINRTLHKQHGIGPRAVREIEEIIVNVCAVLPPNKPAAEQRALDLKNKVLAERGYAPVADMIRDEVATNEALCRAVEEIERLESELDRMTRLRDKYRAAYYEARK